MTDSARPFEGLALAVAAPSRQWVTNEGGIDWALRRRRSARLSRART